MKTLIIGLDSATWRVIKKLVSQGKLPNLEALIHRGSSGELDSSIPPMTPLAWTSIATGVNPGKHGVYDFFVQDRKTYKIIPVNNSYLNRYAIWDIFNAYEKKVGFVNFPLAFPPPKVKSFFIAGIGAPECGDFTYPDDLRIYLKNKRYRIYPIKKPLDGARRYLEDIKDLTSAQIKISLDLLKNRSWELFCIVLNGIDWIQHYFWNQNILGSNTVEVFYKYVDDQIEKLLQEAHADWNIVILSDHGARKICGEIHINNLLEDWGYLKRRSIYKSVLQEHWEFLVRFSWQMGRKLLPSSTRQTMKSILPQAFRKKAKMLQAQQLRLHELIDWEQTQAFSYGNMGKIYIHTRDNYHKGIVESGQQYRELRGELINKLRSLRNPKSGEPLFDQVFSREDLYSGTQLDSAPDIIFTPKNDLYMASGDFGSSWFLSSEQYAADLNNKVRRIADHDRKGIFILAGPNIQHVKNIRIKTEDITPTLLYLHGLPILKDMDGKVQYDLIKPELVKHLSAVRTDSILKSKADSDSLKSIIDKTEQEEIENRLRNLGYI